jgi:hypothetical protein
MDKESFMPFLCAFATTLRTKIMPATPFVSRLTAKEPTRTNAFLASKTQKQYLCKAKKMI